MSRFVAAADELGQPDLSIIIVTYNNAAEIAACLRALPAASGPQSWEAIVVDNASGDGTVSQVRAVAPDTRLILSPANQGFARAVNQAAGLARGRWLVLLNPDAVAAPDCFASLVQAAEANPRAGLLGGRIVSPQGETKTGSAWNAPSFRSIWCFALGLTAVSQSVSARRLVRARGSDRWRSPLDPETVRWPPSECRLAVEVVSGCLLLVERSVWQALGGFDPRFLLYGEDLDLSLRARRAGWRPEVVAAAAVQHAVGRSSPGVGARRRAVLAGRVTYLRKNWSPLTALAGVWLTTAGVGWRAATRRGRAAGWGDAWAARADWRRGYPASASGSPTGLC